MPKNKISEFSSTPANNTDIGGIDIAEGCAPSGINNAIRELMAQLKDQQVGSDADNFTVGGALSVTGTSTLTGAVTATAGVTGNLTGNVTGNVTGNLTGNVTGNVSGTALNVTGTVAVANGGTGQTSSTGSGAVVLATSPTLVTPALGTPSALVGTNITGTANSLNAGLGVNQTWQTTGRTAATLYTNNTSKPIYVSIVLNSTSGGDFGGFLYVDSVLRCNSIAYAANAGYKTTVSIIVPVASSYQFNFNRNCSIDSWNELK
jgi:hypothetical protein